MAGRFAQQKYGEVTIEDEDKHSEKLDVAVSFLFFVFLIFAIIQLSNFFSQDENRVESEAEGQANATLIDEEG